MNRKEKSEQTSLPVTSFPKKMFYRIREVGEITGVKPHVLRYWESEFPGFNPRKNRSGQRLYSKKDVDAALEIRRLLRVEGFSIAGARRRLKKKGGKQTTVETENVISNVRRELAEILELLDKDAG